MTAVSRIRVWDAPTRLVHWLLVALVAFSWWTAENHRMDWHRYSGYALLGVLLFRIYWGFAGSTTARFAHFIKGPRAIIAYLRWSPSLARAQSPEPTTPIGHNPLGALSVVVLLLLLLTQVGLGLFAVDIDGLESGPLSYLVSFDVGRQCAAVHEWVFNVLMVFVALHIGAILCYLVFKHNNLLGPMITGSKPWSQVAPSLKFVSMWWALPGIVAAALIVWWIA